MLETPTISIPRRIVPEVMFPKRRNERDITFAMVHTISRNHKKREIIISQVLAISASG